MARPRKNTANLEETAEPVAVIAGDDASPKRETRGARTKRGGQISAKELEPTTAFLVHAGFEGFAFWLTHDVTLRPLGAPPIAGQPPMESLLPDGQTESEISACVARLIAKSSLGRKHHKAIRDANDWLALAALLSAYVVSNGDAVSRRMGWRIQARELTADTQRAAHVAKQPDAPPAPAPVLPPPPEVGVQKLTPVKIS